jgi:hypothetical protein
VAWLVVGVAICGAVAVAGVRRRMTADGDDPSSPVGSAADHLHPGTSPALLAAEYFQRWLAVVVAIGIILSAILILTPIFIERIMDG